MTTTVVNKKKDAYDIYIGRGSEWGNPYSHKQGTKATHIVASREEAVAKYKAWLIHDARLMSTIHALKDKRLGCFCKPLACHGDVLAYFADLPVIRPGNIYSGGDSSRAWMTNPTALAKKKGKVKGDFPIKYQGQKWEDVETCYQKLKWGIPNSNQARIKLATELMTIKFTTYPKMVDTITKNGGVLFIRQCSHYVGKHIKNTHWEGDGFDSSFIRCLAKSYKNALESLYSLE